MLSDPATAPKPAASTSGPTSRCCAKHGSKPLEHVRLGHRITPRRPRVAGCRTSNPRVAPGCKARIRLHEPASAPDIAYQPEIETETEPEPAEMPCHPRRYIAA